MTYIKHVVGKLNDWYIHQKSSNQAFKKYIASYVVFAQYLGFIMFNLINKKLIPLSWEVSLLLSIMDWYDIMVCLFLFCVITV